jgi:hypothetical protein
MKKKLYSLAYVLMLISIPVLVVCSDATATVYSSISGRVIAEDTGQGVPSVTVIGFLVGENNESHEGLLYASTDTKGTYVLYDLKPGTYLIGFHKKDGTYVNEKPHVEVVLPKGKHVVNANHILTLGGSVSGTVYQSDGTTPMAGVGVYLSVSATQQDWIDNSKYRTTGSDGKFLVQGLPPSDNCTIEIMAIGHAGMTKAIKISKGTVTANVNFTVKSDDSTGISGYIKSSVDNKPIKEAEVDLRDSFGRDIGYTRTDDTGKYSIVGVTPGVYNAVAYWPEGGDWVEKSNILVEYGKSTAVNFEFNIATPISKNIYDIWENFYGVLVPDVFAGAPTAKPPPPLNFPDDSCDADKWKDAIKSAWAAIENTILKNKAICIYDPPLSPGTTLRKQFEEKLKEGISIHCMDNNSEKCTVTKKQAQQGYQKFGYATRGDDNIYICKRAFAPKPPLTSKGCLTGWIFHEFVHLTQQSVPDTLKGKDKKEDEDNAEKQAYGCEKKCFGKSCNQVYPFPDCTCQ